MRPRLLALLLGLVLLAHWTALSWLGAQARSMNRLAPMATPMFTRMVVPVHVAAPRRPPRPGLRRAHVPVTPARAAPQDAALPATATPDEPGSAPPSEAPPDALAQQPSESAQPQAGESEAPAPADQPAAPDSWPADTRLTYSLKGYYRGDMYGSARVQWQREKNRYQVQVDLSMALVVRVSMISQGEVTDSGLVPSAYEEQFPMSVRRVAFDGAHVRFDDGSQALQPTALQDTASQFVELSRRFSTGREALKVGAQVRVWLARPQGMALWTYDVVEEETLQLPEFGAVRAFHLRPRPIANPTGVITAELWFAPSLQYLPVRVRISLGADNFVDLMVKRIEQGPAPAAQPPERRDLGR